MINRIVKMTFDLKKVEEFEKIFEESSEKIRNFPGCHGVKLLRDIENPSIYFTYSLWESQKQLDDYRKSELFIHTWRKTKALFLDNPKAWSTSVINSSFYP